MVFGLTGQRDPVGNRRQRVGQEQRLHIVLDDASRSAIRHRVMKDEPEQRFAGRVYAQHAGAGQGGVREVKRGFKLLGYFVVGVFGGGAAFKD